MDGRTPLIRPAHPADADPIADVWLASFKATYPFPPAHPGEDVRRWIRDVLMPGREVWIAVEPGGSVNEEGQPDVRYAWTPVTPVARSD